MNTSMRMTEGGASTARRIATAAMIVAALAMAVPALAADYVGTATDAGAPTTGTYNGNKASCTAAARGLAFDCSSFPLTGYPTGWVTGSGSALGCVAAGPVPTCSADKVFQCDAGSCSCAPGWVSCSGTCQLPEPGSCPAGQTFNACNGQCTGDISAVIHTGYIATDAGQGGASGELRIVGKMTSGGQMTASDFCIAGSGSCLSTNTGLWNKVGAGPNVYYATSDVSVGIGTNAPSKTLDLQASIPVLNIRNTGADNWNGITFARNVLAGGATENWFIGMIGLKNGKGPDNLLRFNANSTAASDPTASAMSLDSTGKLTIKTIQITGAPAPAVGMLLTATDTLGNASWSTVNTCSIGRKFVGVTSVGGASGAYDGLRGGYTSINASPGGVCAQYGTTAKVCTVEEMLNSVTCATGPITTVNTGDAWISGGPPGYTAPANDCDGWKSNAGSYNGRKWRFTVATGGAGYLGTCNEIIPFACCN